MRNASFRGRLTVSMDDWELWLSSAGKINATFAIHDEYGAGSFSGLKIVN